MLNWTLDISSVIHTVKPTWKSGAKLQKTPESGKRFLREKLNIELIFQRADYDLIHGAAFQQKFIINMSGDHTWQGIFYKTDCDFDEDRKTIRVQPEPNDRYKAILEGLDKEFDLIKLEPELSTISYVKQPLFQVYLAGSEKITNHLGGLYWEQEIDGAPISYLMSPNGFSSSEVIGYIPGDNLDPDVSGMYRGATLGSNYGYLRDDSKYFILQVYSGVDFTWHIIDKTNSDNIVYKSNLNSSIFGFPKTHANKGNLFYSETSSSEARFFAAFPRFRILTDEETVNGNPTDPLPDPDIVTENYGYKNTYTVVALDDYAASVENSISPTQYGKFSNNADYYANSYFVKYPAPFGLLKPVFPVARSEWTEVSFWFYYSFLSQLLQEDAATSYTTKHAYEIGEVIRQLLAEIDNTITFLSNTTYSEFLYSATNPVSSDLQPALYVVPKSNILVGDYDQPAQKAMIKLNDVFELLENRYNLKWFIDSSNRLRIEHESWFEKGGSYTSNQVGLDLTTLLEPKTGKNWGFGANKYKYEKAGMPQQIKFDWMEDCSEPFNGFPIEITSNYVQKGNIEEKNASQFISDIDYAQVQPGNFSKSGFFILAAFDVSGTMTVPFKTHQIQDGREWKMQNGHLANIYLHDKYFKHGLPATNVNINESSTTATTVKRSKIQDDTFPGSTIDELQLITTGLGTGEIREYDTDLTTGAHKIKIAHDN